MGAGSSTGGKKGDMLETMADHEESINCMCLSEDGSMLVTGSEDATARMWATKTEETECLGVLKGHSSYINCVAVQDTYVITGGADSTIRKWDMTTCECLFVYEGHSSRIQKILLTGDFIFSSSFDKTARAWLFDVSELGEGNEERACIKTFKGHQKGVYPLVFIPASDELGEEENGEGPTIRPGDILVTGSADMTARTWSFESSGCLKQFRGHTGAVTTMATDTIGKVLFTAGADSTIKSWNIQSAQLLKTFEGHTRMILQIIVTPKSFYSSSTDLTVRGWVYNMEECVRIYKGHQHSVSVIMLENNTLWTACGDSIVRAFDAKSGAVKRSFVGHEAAVNCMTLTNGKLYTGSSDGTLRIWDAKDVSDEMVDDGPPPPVPEGQESDEVEVVETISEDNSAQRFEPAADDYIDEEAIVEEKETENADEEIPDDGKAVENPDETAVDDKREEESEEDEEAAKNIIDLEIAAQG